MSLELNHKFNKVTVLNQKIDNIRISELLNIIEETISDNNLLTIATVNPEFLVLSHRNKKFSKVLSDFNIKVADGFGLILMTKLFKRHKLESRITGADLCNKIFSLANKKNLRVILLGSSYDNSNAACSNLRRIYPNIRVKCISGGIIDPDNPDNELLDELGAFNPSILLVGLGAPKQEYFISNHAKNLGANVAIGIGGTIDFISGKTKRAPLFLRKVGLEWLWRLFIEPNRIIRIVNAVIIFPLLFIHYSFKKY